MVAMFDFAMVACHKVFRFLCSLCEVSVYWSWGFLFSVEGHWFRGLRALDHPTGVRIVPKGFVSSNSTPKLVSILIPD